jgi:hypothetical protein
MRRIAAVVAGMSMLLSLGPFTSASADSGSAYAPVDRPGPALRPTQADLDRAVECHGDFSQGKEAVLLVPGTAFTVATQFSWSWGRALTYAGIPWCGVTPPENSLGDATVAGEYDVYAIRKTFAMAGSRPIAVVGHSQGAMRPRWALRFWPDVRPMVADLVSVAPDNEGVSATAPGVVPPLFRLTCTLVACPQGIWQQLAGSNFIAALNSGQQTFPGIDYSVIYSRTDGLVQPGDTVLDPAPGTSYNRVAIQSVCPLEIADHLTNGSTDAVSWAMILDAITHAGPVDPSRLSKSVCTQLFFPGIDYAKALAGGINAPLQIIMAAATTPRFTVEARLPAYVFE